MTDQPILSFGVMTDNHLDPAHPELAERTLAGFRLLHDLGAELLIDCGDITDFWQPEELKHFSPFPVGRLDKDTEGLLLLTNDGQFDHELMSPRKNLYKRYYAELDAPAVAEDIELFASGMEFREFTAKPARLEISPDDPCKVYVEIAEGKYHQVKRMCERVGKNVIFLKRVAIGSLQLDPTLECGKVRELTAEELALFGW